MNKLPLFVALLCALSSSPLRAAEHKQYSAREILAIYGQQKFTPPTPPPFLSKTDREWGELNMPALALKLNRAKTAAGFAEFESLLQPISCSRELEKRQHLFTLLVFEKALFSDLESVVAELDNTLESLFIHFLDEHARVLFIQEPTLAMFGKRSSMYQMGLQSFMTALFLQGVVYDQRQLARAYHDFRAQGGYLARTWLGYNLLGQGFGLAWGAYYTASTAIATWQRVSQADAYVLKAGHALDVVRRAQAIINDAPKLKHSVLGDAFNEIKPKSAFLGAANRYANENSSLKALAVVKSLDVYDALKDAKEELANALRAMALLDAYMSVARLYHEYSARGIPMSFAYYDNGDQIRFSFKGLINPLVDNAVPNDIALGTNGSRHIVLTGPHGCGKTTIMKSVAHGFILPQSITLVPASFGHLTPLTDIKSYINVGDNLEEGLSSFMAEHKRVDELARFARELPSDRRALILVDEPYAKTIQLIGEPRVSDFMRTLASASNLSAILATHFEGPSLLETETAGVVKNFQPLIDDQLRPTYKIGEGAATWWFHDIAKRDSFIDKLIGLPKSHEG